MLQKPPIRRAEFISSPNIAVVKYWGKRDQWLHLPTNSSLSITIDSSVMHTSTTVELHTDSRNSKVEATLNGEEIGAAEGKRLFFVVSRVRAARLSLEDEHNLERLSDCDVKISSFNSFPTASGLASSASGYSALAKCLAEVFRLYDEHPSELSVSEIARLGSGSAARSVYGGYVVWEAGIRSDGSDSIARQLYPASHWDLSVLILIVSERKKAVSSTAGMAGTVLTSELFELRAAKAQKRVADMSDAIRHRDFDKFAELTMRDSNQMHALCLDTFPPIVYMNSVSHEIVSTVNAFNCTCGQGPPPGKEGRKYRAAYTFDAGPNATLFCEKDSLGDLLSVLVQKFGPSGAPSAPFVSGTTVEYVPIELSDYPQYGEKMPGQVRRIVVSGVSHHGAHPP